MSVIGISLLLENHVSVSIFRVRGLFYGGKAYGSFELNFVNNYKGEVTAVIVRSPGGPVRERKKLKNEK